MVKTDIVKVVYRFKTSGYEMKNRQRIWSSNLLFTEEKNITINILENTRMIKYIEEENLGGGETLIISAN